MFGYEFKHEFTGIDYVEYYKSFSKGVQIHFSNNPKYILEFTKNILVFDIHSRKNTMRILKENGAEKLFGLEDICNKKNEEKGYNEEYGLLGSNKVGEDRLKLFPRDGQELVEKIQKMFKEETGKKIEVMIYGDGALKTLLVRFGS